MQPVDEIDQRNYVQSLERGLAVILAFSGQHPRLTLTEIARATGLTRATARRLLLTLQHLGYVRTDGKYHALTPKVLALGHAYLSSVNLGEIAQHELGRIARATGQSCSLLTLDGTDAVFIARVPGSGGVASLTAGARLPAHLSAGGHALLAGLTPDELAHYLDHATLTPLTPHSTSSADQLRAKLHQVRARGWAMIDQEVSEGVQSAAAPIRDATGRTAAAIGFSWSVAAVDPATVRQDFIPLLLDAASRISEQLGAAFSPDGRRRAPEPRSTRVTSGS
jgi:IclR family transcriptional regulator, pca regulon regulatory protein